MLFRAWAFGCFSSVSLEAPRIFFVPRVLKFHIMYLLYVYSYSFVLCHWLKPIMEIQVLLFWDSVLFSIFYFFLFYLKPLSGFFFFFPLSVLIWRYMFWAWFSPFLISLIFFISYSFVLLSYKFILFSNFSVEFLFLLSPLLLASAPPILFG